MWNLTTKTMAGLAMGALALTAGGCASTPKDTNLAYSHPDEKITGPQPPRANTIYGMTRLMRAQGKTEQAELALVGLMKEFPNYSPTYNDLAEIRIEQGRLDEAIRYVETGLMVAPNDAVLLNNAGVCSLMVHDYKKALDYFQRASNIAPYDNRYRANVALALGLTGDTEGSRALYYQIVPKEAAEHNSKLIESLVAPKETQAQALAANDIALWTPQEPIVTQTPPPAAEVAPVEAPIAVEEPVVEQPAEAPVSASSAVEETPEPFAVPQESILKQELITPKD